MSHATGTASHLLPLSTLRIAWRNLGRNRRRTALAVGAIALGQLTLVFINGMMAGWWQEMLETVTGPMVGHVQIHHAGWRKERAVDLYLDGLAAARAQIEALEAVRRAAPRLYAPCLAAAGERADQPAQAEPAMVVGVDVDLECGPGGLLEGLEAGARPGNRTVAVGRVLASRLALQPGQELALIGQDADGFPASDLFRVNALVGTHVDVVRSMGVVLSLADAGAFLGLPDQAHEIVVHGRDPDQAGALATTIASLASMADADVLSWRQAAPEIVRMIDMKGWFDVVFLLIVFVAAAAGIANTATMSAFERTHEFGMLLAVGARPARIVVMVLAESLVIGLLGVAIGSVLGAGLVGITSQTGINYAALARTPAEDFVYGGLSISYLVYPRLEVRHILFGLWAVTLTSILASAWPAVLAARLEPVEALRS